ncbi:MAG: DUF5050 domain-containing protein [Clostridiales bacterium]|nr:DUF5050 domain-containing protein [Clostridiales bacterium]
MDRGEKGETETEPAFTVYGHSANMRNGGLVEGDEKGIYFVQNDSLYYVPEGKEVQIVDEMGARFLCLTEDTLYYVSSDENGKSGIYARENGTGGKRRLVLETGARYLYEYGGYLYFINYPDGTDICRVGTDGSGFETLTKGSFDSLIVTEKEIFYRNFETKQYRKQSFKEDGSLSEAEEWIALSEDVMPILDGEWIYYELGDFLYHYKVSTTDKNSLGRLARTSDNMVIRDGMKFENGSQLDLSTGEQSQWSEEPYTRLYGIAGGKLIYEVYEYGEEKLLWKCPVPESVSLYVYDIQKRAKELLLETGVTEKVTAAEAVKSYDGLMAGNLTLLRENSEAFARYFPLSGKWKSQDADFDGDGIPERFLLSENKESILLNADSYGITCYLFDVSEPEEWYEPLSNDTVLYRHDFEADGYGNEVYNVYRFRNGGNTELLESCQHITTDMSLPLINPETDTLMESDFYYVSEKFTDGKDWQNDVDQILEKRVFQ